MFEPHLRILKRMSPSLQVRPRTLRRIRIAAAFRTVAAAILAVCALAIPAWRFASAAPVRPQINVTGYVITADLDPAVNRLTATAEVTFTALEDITSATFELNNGLAITKLTDSKGAALNSERLTNNSTVHVNLTTPIVKGTSTTFHFEYSGALVGSETSPVEGIKLAAVADPIAMLL